MPVVHLPATLRPLAGGVTSVDVEGDSLRTVIANLEMRFPALAGRIADSAGIRPEICLAVGNEEAFGLDQAVSEGSEVHILPAIAGG